MDFSALTDKDYVILDGAMGTMLQRHGLEGGMIPEYLNMTNPGLITGIHLEYINSGADIIYTNTFGANSYKLKGSPYSLEEIISNAVKNAKTAVSMSKSHVAVALDIGPIGKMIEPLGDMSFEKCYNYYKEIVICGKNSGADMAVLETMSDLLEIKAALLAVKENSSLPVICTMTFEENMHTFTGVSIPSAALTLDGLGADAIGINCSLGPAQLKPLIEQMQQYTDLPLVIKPNAGLPDPETGIYNMKPYEYGEHIAQLASSQIKFFGGCCGTDPEYIKATIQFLKNINFKYKYTQKDIPSSVCSQSKTIILDRPRIIGERINPTGKKLFKEALINNNINYILTQAIEQINAGADILDVNVGLPDIDEKSMMLSTVKALQNITNLPLQIDSTNPYVLESALRIYNGKPIVNSVNGEEESLNTILPIVKKYGASVVCLTLDENGIPAKARDRIKIAERILDKALSYGIPKRDIYIDCLTLTVSAEPASATETLSAVKTVKEDMGLKTVLGVSNISFGLPNRELVNHSFLTMALYAGLTLPIMNPNIKSMTDAVKAYNLLSNTDKNAEEYLNAFSSVPPIQKAEDKQEKTDIQSKLTYSIEKGLADEAADITSALLKYKEPMYIIDNILIPALDRAGNDFETGKTFLPQLILSANSAQGCFGIIKEHFSKQNIQTASKGRIMLATVKGDIHDIGKNIVKVLLENYGYDIMDLGRDVEPKIISDASVSENISLVGLSALMTTTLGAMEETIHLLNKNNPNCKIMVGGAVLTPEYARKINADFYAKDAKAAVDIARTHFGS